MSRITESIDSISDQVPTKVVYKPKQPQKEKKDWESLIVSGNLYDKDDDW